MFLKETASEYKELDETYDLMVKDFNANKGKLPPRLQSEAGVTVASFKKFKDSIDSLANWQEGKGKAAINLLEIKKSYVEARESFVIFNTSVQEDTTVSTEFKHKMFLLAVDLSRFDKNMATIWIETGKAIDSTPQIKVMFKLLTRIIKAKKESKTK